MQPASNRTEHAIRGHQAKARNSLWCAKAPGTSHWNFNLAPAMNILRLFAVIISYLSSIHDTRFISIHPILYVISRQRQGAEAQGDAEDRYALSSFRTISTIR